MDLIQPMEYHWDATDLIYYSDEQGTRHTSDTRLDAGDPRAPPAAGGAVPLLRVNCGGWARIILLHASFELLQSARRAGQRDRSHRPNDLPALPPGGVEHVLHAAA